MKALVKSVGWLAGILVGVFGGSIVLAWYDFGWLDWGTVRSMALLLLPLLLAALGVLAWAALHEPPRERKPAPPPERPEAVPEPLARGELR